MAWTGRLTLLDCEYVLDGGSMCLSLRDAGGGEHTVTLMQHAFPDGEDAGKLYADGQLVPIRSALETQVLAALAAAEIAPAPEEPRAEAQNVDLNRTTIIFGDDIRDFLTREPDENLRALRDQLIAFVQSDEYVSFAKQVEQALRNR